MQLKEGDILFSYCPSPKLIAPCQCLKINSKANQLNCSRRNLTDATACAILDAYLNTRSVTPLQYLDLRNNQLTRVPRQLKLFPQLQTVVLDENTISIVRWDDFNLTARLKYFISLSGNQLNVIEPGALQGIQLVSF